MIVELWNDPALWDAYVDAAPDASNYHRWVWKEVIEEAWGHRTYYLAAVNNGTIQGVLPLVWMKSRLSGRFLVPMPFFSYGGVVASDEQARIDTLRGRRFGTCEQATSSRGARVTASADAKTMARGAR